MNIRNHSYNKYIFLLSGLFIIWIILFEYILPPNLILPKPSIVALSIYSLFQDYQFLVNTFSSISAIYISSIIAGLFIWILKRYLFTNKNFFSYLAYFLKWISGIVPGIIMGLFLILWFPYSEFSKYIFVFFACFIYLFNKVEIELKKVNNELIDAVVSLGAGDKFILDKVRWKIIEPAVVESLTDMHFNLWSILIVFEFIKGGSGLGTILRTAILFKDLAGLFVSVVVISLLILVSTAIINYFKNKIIYWSII